MPSLLPHELCHGRSSLPAGEPSGRAVLSISLTLLPSAPAALPNEVSSLDGTPHHGQFISKCQARIHSQALEGIPLPSSRTTIQEKIIFQMLPCREGNGTPSSILASEIPGTEELGGLQSNSRAFLRGENSPGEAEALAEVPRAFDGTARTVAEDSQWPGLLILASRYMCGKLESKICLRASLVALW